MFYALRLSQAICMRFDFRFAFCFIENVNLRTMPMLL